MGSSGLKGGLYRPLNMEQVRTIHEAALGILERTGIGFEPDLRPVVDLLVRSGAEIIPEQNRLRIPRNLIEECLDLTPERVVLFSRDGNNDLDLGDDRVHLGTGGAAVKILDQKSGRARPTTLQDLYLLARLVDKLPNIHFFLRPCIPTDIPETDYDANVFYACFKGTAKHVMAGVNTKEAFHDVLEMAASLAKGLERLKAAPFFSIITSFVISPLKLSSGPVRIMLECVKNRIPVALSGAPMAGSTSPLTMAGTLAQTHAEQLAGIALAQSTSPSAPLLYGGIPSRADLQTMNYCGGAIECGMMNAAIHQLADYVRVPNYNSSGLTDSKIPDAQAGWEKGMTTLLTAMSGSNYIHHAAGMLESMICVAFEQYVLDDEIIGMASRVLQGIEVDPEHLALEVIDQVGPGGEFMTAEHTFKHMRTEYFQGNRVSDRSNRTLWNRQGEKDAWARARELAARKLVEPGPEYIPQDLDQRLRERFELRLEESEE
ncbi:MAG: trimethylamine methyltransferase family protein [Desulfohalobiaceae bacterium]|nr:trimethylamine methyltransferase family protein [Desulfohalobiaceae bacterium]